MGHEPIQSPIDPSAFAGYRFPPEAIMLAVGWCLRYGLSYRDVEETLVERGIEVDPGRNAQVRAASRAKFWTDKALERAHNPVGAEGEDPLHILTSERGPTDDLSPPTTKRRSACIPRRSDGHLISGPHANPGQAPEFKLWHFDETRVTGLRYTLNFLP